MRSKQTIKKALLNMSIHEAVEYVHGLEARVYPCECQIHDCGNTGTCPACELQTQVEQREALIRDSITHLCSYCMDNKERGWDDMQRHIYECEKHPLSKLKKQVDCVEKLKDEWRKTELRFGQDTDWNYEIRRRCASELEEAVKGGNHA